MPVAGQLLPRCEAAHYRSGEALLGLCRVASPALRSNARHNLHNRHFRPDRRLLQHLHMSGNWKSVDFMLGYA